MATGRIGVTPTLGTRWSKAPAGGTTSLSGLDDNSVALVYSVGYEQVYRNGVLLSRGNDYTATSGNSITLTDATIAGDIIEVFANELVPLTDAISKGQFTAKGALLSATAASTPAVLTVGTNGQYLTANSSTSTGLEWTTNTVTQPFLGYKVSGNLYGIATITAPAARSGVVANTTYYYAIYFDGQTTFDRIGMRTAAGFSGTGVFRLGIYNASLTTGKPTTVYLDAGTVSATAAATDYMITINTTPPAGYYFIAGNCQTAAATNTITGIGTASPNIVNPFGKTSSSGFGYNYFAESVTVTGGFATAGTLTDERTIDVLGYLRIA